MHDGEVDIDSELVRVLIRTQFPQFGDPAIDAVPSTGTVNAMYRLGTDLCVRMPRVALWSAHLEKELEWLPVLSTRVSLAVPERMAKGEPGNGYPFPWAIYRWIDGDTYAIERVDDERRAALDLAVFVAELRQVDPSGAPRSGRKPLGELDAVTRSAIESIGDGFDADAVTGAWDRALEAPSWDGVAVWRHGDLLPPNILVAGGRLAGVIDFGSVVTRVP